MVVSDITARIARYLPKFVNPEGEVSSKIFAVIGTQMKAIYDEIEKLKEDDQSGRGLLLRAGDSQIFFDTKEAYEDEKLLELVQDCLDINAERATETGLLNDLNNIHREEAMRWEDVTPEGSDIFCPVMDVTYYTGEYYGIDLQKMIIIDEGDGVRPLTDRQKRVIEQKLIPKDTTVIFV